jgi:hypothetical protein
VCRQSSCENVLDVGVLSSESQSEKSSRSCTDRMPFESKDFLVNTTIVCFVVMSSSCADLHRANAISVIVALKLEKQPINSSDDI